MHACTLFSCEFQLYEEKKSIIKTKLIIHVHCTCRLPCDHHMIVVIFIYVVTVCKHKAGILSHK